MKNLVFCLIMLFSYAPLLVAQDPFLPGKSVEEMQKQMEETQAFRAKVAVMKFVEATDYPVVDLKSVKLPDLRQSVPADSNLTRSKMHYYFSGHAVWHEMTGRAANAESVHKYLLNTPEAALCVDNPFAGSELPPGLFLIAEPQRKLGSKMCLCVVNTTGKNVLVPAMDGNLMICMEAKNPTGEWKAVESVKTSWCGNSFMSEPVLPAGKAWEIPVHRYRGDFETTFRFRMSDPPLVSNEFAGSVNLQQFERGDMEDEIFVFPRSKATEEALK